ncbi:DEAD/DEAH box helicase [Nocardia sp. NPDC051900]|uniref:DEAD/DEAH box helicase n=1 Tax=Nocardia sp. NPDC051900 TaxID=3364326 RepID=UPI00379D7399
MGRDDPRASRQARIVRYWRAVEYFTPQKVDAPSRENSVVELHPRVTLPWHARRSTPPDRVWRYTVYAGVFGIKRVREVLDTVLAPDDEPSDPGGRKEDDTALVSLTLDETGRLYKSSVTLSSCAWAVGRTVGTPGPGADDWLDGFADQQARMLRVLFDIGDGRIPIENGEVRSRGARAVRLVAGVAARIAIDVGIGGLASLPGLVGSVIESRFGETASTVAESVTDAITDDAIGALEDRRDRADDESAETATTEKSTGESLGTKVLELDDLAAIARWVSEELGVDEVLEPSRIWVKCFTVPQRRADEVSGDELLNSFYVGDLERVARELDSGNVGAALSRYLTEDESTAASGRVDVRRDPSVLLRAVHPRKMPTGRWPEKPTHPLALSQQFAINTIIDELADPHASGIYAVNGPPGTGKTTMLRDLIASIIVDRAAVLSELSRPRAAFREQQLRWEDDEGWARKLTPLIDDLTGFEIVFASSNNGAVENITLEVPSVASIDREAFPDAEYFAGPATYLAEVPCWGAIAARLGKRANRKDFAQRFWWGPRSTGNATEDRTEVGIDSILRDLQEVAPDERARSWRDAVRRFRAASERVDAMATARAAIADCLALTGGPDPELDALRRQLLGADGRERELRAHREQIVEMLTRARAAAQRGSDRVEAAEAALADARDAVARADYALARAEAVLHAQGASRPGWWRRFFSRGADRDWADAVAPYAAAVEDCAGQVRRADESREQCDAELRAALSWRADLDRAVIAAQGQLGACDRERASVQLSTQAAQRAISRHEAQIARARAQLDQARREWPGAVPGPEWNAPSDDRAAMEARERSAPWMDEEFAMARSEVLIAALDLHYATLAAEPKLAWDNLRAAIDVVSGDSPDNLSESTVLAAWQMLFFVVPTLSTTFASLPTMFAGLGRESLGWLCIDEAGQATPQAAVGALWRSRRAVVVGDPRQLEPVVSLPWQGQRRLAHTFDVDVRWAPQRASVQAVADRVTKFGTWLPDLDSLDQIWVGSPLRVHRRCDRLMFEVSNAIAYDHMMVNGVSGRSADFELGNRNLWIDIPAKADGPKWNPLEGKYVLTILRTIRQRLEAAMDEESAEPTPERASTDKARNDELRRRLENSVFIVSPFRDVVTGLAQYLRGNGMPISDTRLGTVHTTQGKEADIVILVLGTATDGKRARDWASAAPNLLNVAITRARRRLVVVGDYENWASLRNFAVLARHTQPGGELHRWRPGDGTADA